jgi:preprotein translocase subunit SecA
MEYLSDAVDALLETYCASPADDEWDLDGLSKELKTFWPNAVTEDQLDDCRNTREIAELVLADATEHYAKREQELTPTVMREVERQVMLRIIDQRWREHLEEMDYLKEGINLRAMGQKDPLTEWQREGFEMFGSMMKGIAQDFVRYVMHVQVVRQDQQPAAGQPGAPAQPPVAGQAAPAAPATQTAPAAAAPAPAAAAPAATQVGAVRQVAPAIQNLTTSSSDTEQVSAFREAAAAAGAAARPAQSGAPRREQPKPKQETVVKDEWAKTPRNAPCPCGSGKKFKLCHGQV